MADAFVQVQPDQAGKKVQTFETTVGGQVVEAQATVTVDPTTGAAVSLATQATLASVDGKTPALVVGRVPVDVASLPLPAGGATETTLASIAAAVSGLDDQGPSQGVLVQGRDNSSGDVHPLNVDGEGNVSVFTQSLPLPAGAALEAGNLAAIRTALSGVLQVAQAAIPLPTNAAQEAGNLQSVALVLQDVLTEMRRHTLLLSAILGATGNGVPDQAEIDSQLSGGNPWPQ